MLPGRGGRDAVNALLSHARAGLVVLHPTPNYLDSYPVKLFEYMSAGLPVIASDFPLWRRIIEDSCCGLLVDPRDPSAIARAMTWLLEHPDEAENMGQSGLRAVLSKYNWADQSRRLLAMYARLTAYDHKSLRGRSATVNTAAYIAGDVETHSRQV
jgi:glycosyltransferase involved in cell wall biosynthesis